MPAPPQELLATIRKASLSGPWSQGVKLAREGAVLTPEARGDLVVVRVRAPGQTVAPTVTLYPADGEWSCDCGSPVDPCSHVAAAVIAWASPEAAAPPKPDAPASSSSPAPASPVAPPRAPLARAGAHLRYQLERRDGVLNLKRFVVSPAGTAEPVRGSIQGAAGRTLGGGLLVPTHEDITIDRMVGARQHGYFPEGRTAELFAALSTCSDVRLGDQPIKTSGEAIMPRAVVEDQKGAIALTIDRDPRIQEIVVAGVARVGQTLHALGETELSGDRLERLPLKRSFALADVGRLVTDVLPGLEKKRVPVEVKSRRLPRAKGGARPRIQLDLSQTGHTLTVTPSLVYGDPAVARIEEGRLVHLRSELPLRDEPAERELLARLRDELHLVPGRAVDFDGDAAIRFATRLTTWSGGGAEGAQKELFGKGQLVPRFKLDDESFDLTFDLVAERDERDSDPPEPDDSGPKRSATAAAVIRAWENGLPLVPLEGGGFAPLPRDFLAKHGARVADLLAARREDGKVERAALPALGELCDALEIPRPLSLAKLAPMIEGFESIPEAPLPEGLRATLRPYQRTGVSWLCFLRDAGLGGVLADDMGLGKTLETICALEGRALVVCPRSVVHNWADEIARFRPGLRTALYHGPKRSLDPKADVTLTTYAILRLDAEALGKEPWSAVVLDEAQAIKNPESQAARAAFDLQAGFRLALSGTPVENRLDELWSLFHFTNRGLLGGRSGFDQRHARPILAGEPGAAEALRKKIRPFVLRRKKRDVAPELPPRTDSTLYCELEDDERAVYDAVLAATRKDVVARLGEGGSVLAALEALLRLRQAACHSSLVPGQRAESSSKVTRLVEALEDAAADGHKALVFSQWTSFLDLVEPHLRQAKIGFTRLDGSTRDRAGVVAEFQGESGPPVMLISLKAGGTGLNLTAADHVFLLDPWWNPAVEDQAADRAHRIGQDRPVLVHRLVAKDTVEERILALQERKRSIADAALGEADRAAGLTREDLLDLLR